MQLTDLHQANMKKRFQLSGSVLLLAALSLTSCFESQLIEEELETAKSKTVSFSLSTFTISQSPIGSSEATRADPPAITVSPTRLLIIDVVNDVVEHEIEKTDNVLENFSLTLSYGTHDIYILATATAFDSYSSDDLTVSWSVTNRPSYTWAKKVRLNVSQESTSSQSITLPLVIGRIELFCNDAQDPSATKMQISGKMNWTLDLTTMKGVMPTDLWTYTIGITKTTAGLSFAVYSFEPTEKNQNQEPSIGNLTYTALKTVEGVDSEITHHTLIDVPVSAGVITKYTGLFYSNTQAFSLSTASQWTNTVENTY